MAVSPPDCYGSEEAKCGSNMSNLAVIVNPTSRSGRATAIRGAVEELAKREGIEVYETERPRHATELARRLAEGGFDRVIAVGGDGTLNEVANGLAHSSTALAVVPAGTGNDWVRTVGISRVVEEAWSIAVGGRVVTTDLAEVDGHGFCLNVLGAGFDAEVARRISEAKGMMSRLGPTPRYVASVLGAFTGYQRSRVTVKLDDRSDISIPDVLLVAVGVAKYYGSGMKVLPDSVIDDGLLDIVWGSGITSLELPGILARVFKGTHTSHKKVATARCRTIRLVADSPTPFHIDGDVRGVLPISVTVRANALKIVVP